MGSKLSAAVIIVFLLAGLGLAALPAKAGKEPEQPCPNTELIRPPDDSPTLWTICPHRP
jgi:hypothetical protein